MSIQLAPPDWSALEKLLRAHPCADARESEDVARVLSFLRAHPHDAHLRSQPLGHLTGSAFLLDATGARVLLLHHGKLNRWLQPGGHGEGELDPRAIALREVEEETGFQPSDLSPLPDSDLKPREAPLFDVDIHTIPARPNEPEHSHLDLRFAWKVRAGATPRLSSESRALDWFSLENPPAGADPALLRAFHKLRNLSVTP